MKILQLTAGDFFFLAQLRVQILHYYITQVEADHTIR